MGKTASSKANHVAISFVGFHDPFFPAPVEGADQEGPVLGLLRAKKFDGAILLSTPNTVGRTAETAEAVAVRLPDIRVRVEHIEMDDPTDYFEILAGLRSTHAAIRDQYRSATFYVGTASGTPQMHACWLMLVASGEIPARLLQTRPPQFVSAEKPPVTEIDPTSDEFPIIRANTWSQFSDESETADLARVVSDLNIIGETVSQQDLDDLCSLVLTQEPGLDLHDLAEYFPLAGGLDQAIRGIIGMDAEAVHDRFTAFVQAHPNLASHQIKFLDLLQNHIAKFGSIEVAQLYEPPFTILHSDGPDGLFDEPLVDELLDILGTFQSEEY